MLRHLQKFIPGFLLDLDRKWLVNRPGLWATRIHYVLFFGGLGTALALLFTQTRSISLQSVPHVFAEGWLVAIPTLLAFLFWAWTSSQ
ncbi:MAG: hypothetical protein AAFV07_15725, partial [Bacteroidota bacterium]